jgi:hypothetical protein
MPGDVVARVRREVYVREKKRVTAASANGAQGAASPVGDSPSR